MAFHPIETLTLKEERRSTIKKREAEEEGVGCVCVCDPPLPFKGERERESERAREGQKGRWKRTVLCVCFLIVSPLASSPIDSFIVQVCHLCL